MQSSKKIQRLVVASLVIVMLALATHNSMRDNPASTKQTTGTSANSYRPRDIDPSALDWNGARPGSITSSPIKQPEAAKPVAPKPAVSAEAYLVANLDTGEVYAARNAKAVFPIASLSKLVTALVASHNIAPTQKITITQPMLDAYGDAGHFTLGETFTFSEIFYPLLLESSNDAAEGIAQSYGYSDFIQKMNAFTIPLGMTSTSFHDASGLSSGNISNAENLFLLARYNYGNEKPLLDITRQTTYSVASTTDHAAHTWNTINPFPFDPHFIGGKTGRTIEAKESMISMFKYVHEDNEYHVAIIVLRSEFSDRETDTAYLFEQFIKKIDGI